MAVRLFIACVFTSMLLVATAQEARAQAFGVELRNTLMPASGGLGGTSIARPQDVQSALGGNPATMTQFTGTNFGMSGAWVEPRIKLDNRKLLPLAKIVPFKSTSNRPGSMLGNIAVTQELPNAPFPITLGTGLITASGLGIDFRQDGRSNGTSAELVVLNIGAGVGVKLTENLSIGADLAVSSSTLDGPFSGIAAATPAYALRGLLGATYEAGYDTTLGFTWWTPQDFIYEDAVRLGGRQATFNDIAMGLPSTFGWGVANNSLMDGQLLLMADILYMKWSDTDFFGAIWDDQFALQTGAQYTLPSGVKLRAGYVYAQSVMRDLTAPTIGGISPQRSVDYLQALFPNINRHRFTFGVGVPNLLPNVDLDFYAGGMPEETHDSKGTSVSISSWWIGGGSTWKFGGCCRDNCTSDNCGTFSHL